VIDVKRDELFELLMEEHNNSAKEALRFVLETFSKEELEMWIRESKFVLDKKRL